MKIYLNIILLSAVFAGISSCKKSEGTLTPSNIDVTYHLPQGNNSFDQTIVDYYNKFGSYILYKFTERDAYWTPTGWRKPVGNSAGNWTVGGEVQEADQTAITAQLDLLDKNFFSLYPQNFLKQFLPAKILLCSKVDSVYTAYVFNPTYSPAKGVKKVPAYYSYDNIAINHGDANISQLTDADKLAFLARVNRVFFQSIIDRALINPSAEFVNSANYSTNNSTQAIAYGKGIILSYSATLTAVADWNAYITAMVTLSEADLNRSVANTNTSPVGILNPTKDTNGMIRKRYNIVRNYFINTYQVDLQSIGNKSRGV